MSMLLATMASICEKNKIDYEDIMQEFSEFINNDKYTQYYTFDYDPIVQMKVKKQRYKDTHYHVE